MQKTSLLFWILGIVLTALGTYESFFPSTGPTLFIRLFGLAALLFTCVSLLIGPLMVIWPKSFAPLIEPRRAVGLSAFIFMLAHFILVLVHTYSLDIGLLFLSLPTLIALPAFLLFTLIAFISSDFALRKLGNQNWKRIQRLNYVAFVLIAGHFFLSEKGPLLVLPNGKTFINLAEIFLWILIGLTLLLQLTGFWIRIKKEKPPVAAPPASPVPPPMS